MGENHVNPEKLWKQRASEKLKALMEPRNLKVTKEQTRRRAAERNSKGVDKNKQMKSERDKTARRQTEG